MPLFFAEQLLCIRYTMQTAAMIKKIIAVIDGTIKNKIPKQVETKVKKIAIKENVARFWSFLICNLSSSFN